MESFVMSCNCLCSINHPKVKGVCTNTFDRIMIFKGPTVGQRDVQMCDPCADATLEYAKTKEK